MKLEQSMRDLLVSCNAVNFTLGISRFADQPEHVWFNASVQWIDASQIHGRGMAHMSADTIEAAVSGMFEILSKKRGATALADEALPQQVAA